MALAISLLRCTPDLSSLSSGMSSTAGGLTGMAGASNGGVSARAGATASGGDGHAGMNSGGTAGATQGAGGTAAGAGESAGGSDPATGGAAGEAGSGTAGSGMAGSGMAGSGTAGSCAFTPLKALAVDAFDQGLTGQGFAPVMAVPAAMTTNTASSVAWDANVGRTCPGAFRVTGTFKSYTASAQIAIGDIRFPAANWTGAVALHGWIKVSPASAPLQGIQLFVVSGSNAGGFLGVFDSTQFSYDTWYELAVPLVASSDLDPTQVLRVGLQIVLKTAGSPGIPASPPVVSAWLDDLWVEK